jgi:acyl-CoA synthetase (AMP-forming)/AMP-acid ligase II
MVLGKTERISLTRAQPPHPERTATVASCGETGEVVRISCTIRIHARQITGVASYIRIIGRAKDIIIRGGENIPVVEIEGLLHDHPACRWQRLSLCR